MPANDVNVGQDFTFPASTDLSAKFGFLAVLNGSSQVAVAGSNVSCIGVIQDGPSASGRRTVVRCFGIAKVILGGSVTVNDKLASDASGKAVKATVASVSAGTPEPLAGSYVVGIALSSGSSGDIIGMLLTHAGITN